MEQQRKKLQRQLKSKMKDISAYQLVKGVPNAPTANAINNMLNADNFNINTLIYAVSKLGGEVTIKW